MVIKVLVSAVFLLWNAKRPRNAKSNIPLSKLVIKLIWIENGIQLAGWFALGLWCSKCLLPLDRGTKMHNVRATVVCRFSLTSVLYRGIGRKNFLPGYSGDFFFVYPAGKMYWHFIFLFFYLNSWILILKIIPHSLSIEIAIVNISPGFLGRINFIKFILTRF